MKILLPKNRMTGVDLIIAAASILVFFLAVLLLFTSKSSSEIEVITADGKTVYSLENDGAFELTSNGYSYTLEIADGNAQLTEASCPDKTCVHMTPVGKNNGAIICVPGGLVIKTSAERGTDGEADIVIP